MARCTISLVIGNWSFIGHWSLAIGHFFHGHWSFSHASSKIKLKAHHRRPAPRQLRVKRERVEPIIAVIDVQHSDAQLRTAPREPIAQKHIPLPELVPRL